jgi:hypothetical protein
MIEDEVEWYVCPVVLQHEPEKYDFVTPLFIPAKLDGNRIVPIVHIWSRRLKSN